MFRNETDIYWGTLKLYEGNRSNMNAIQMNFNARLLTIVKGVPTILNLKTYLTNFIEFRKEIIIRRTKFDLKKSQEIMEIP